ncbi:MAG: hypothetical protein MUF18_20170 [Fimbriiglobus sp.]|jgi:hypothetical protein|nr:hypothetical protein [Fimbriiglobus sp.]
MKTFRFRAEVRKHVANLLDLMRFANGRTEGRWAHQHGGVYGAAYDGVRLILVETVGAKVYDRLELLGHYASEGVEALEADITDTRADLARDAAINPLEHPMVEGEEEPLNPERDCLVCEWPLNVGSHMRCVAATK